MALNSFKECPICYEVIDNEEDKTILECGHIFHYECITFAYKSNIKSNFNTYKCEKKIRVCPYCRRPGGFLENKLNNIPLQYIHENYDMFKQSLENNNKDYYMKYLNPNKCLAIIKNGVSKGLQCKAKPFSCNSEFCKRHNKN